MRARNRCLARIIWALLMAHAASSFGLVPASASGSAPISLAIYAFDGCGGCFTEGAPCQPCTVLDGLYTSYYQLLESHGLARGATIQLYNTRSEGGLAALSGACADLGIEERGLIMPLVVANGVHCASGERALLDMDAYLSALHPGQAKVPNAPFERPDEGTIVYFHTQYCGDCARTDRFLEARAAALEASDLVLVAYDIAEDQNFALLTEYMAGYDVAHESATVPFLFWGGDAYHGSDAINEALARLDEDG